jgi:hypothetical protein
MSDARSTMGKSNVLRPHSPVMITPTLAPGDNGLDHDPSLVEGDDSENYESRGEDSEDC